MWASPNEAEMAREGSKIWPCGDRGVGARGARRLGQYARGGLPSQDAQYDDPG